jgi:phosphoribosyl 1,2-cyclic phosphodiesterase
MQVRFWGVRGSIPAPAVTSDLEARLVQVLGCLADEPAPPDLKNADATLEWIRTLPAPLRILTGGNTPCVEMRTADGDLFILDAGSGIRPLGQSLLSEEFGQGKGQAHVFFSHYHWDHLQGWPFFPPLYVPGNRFDLYARHEKLKEHLKKQQAAPFFPPAAWSDSKAEFVYHQLTPDTIELCEGRVKVSSITLDHPSRAYAYKFEADGQIFIYASDGAYHDLDEDALRPYIEFYKNADLLIFDAQFSLSESLDEKRTWGHSSAVMGVEIACQAGVKRLALFHHDPAATEDGLNYWLGVAQEYSASMTASGNEPCHVLLACEGESLQL